jgi:hypothetical protein
MTEQMTEEDTKRLFKELVDRTMIITVLRCDECKETFARIEHPKTAKLDVSCDVEDHIKAKKHTHFLAIKHLIIYMNQADKDLANELTEKQRGAFDEFVAKLLATVKKS